MFRHRLPRHIEVLAEGIEGLAVVLMKLVEQGPAARISQCFEDIVHGPQSCNQMVACQPRLPWKLESGPWLLGAGSAPTVRSPTAPRGRLPLQIKRACSEIDDAVMRPQDLRAEQPGHWRGSREQAILNQTFQINHANVLAQDIDRAD